MISTDLADWKQAENSAREQVRGGLMMIAIGQNCYELAQSKIRGLGGKTYEEEHNESKQQKSKQWEGESNQPAKL